MRGPVLLIAIVLGLGTLLFPGRRDDLPPPNAIARAVRFLDATQLRRDQPVPGGEDWAGNWPQSVRRPDGGQTPPVREVGPFLATFVHQALTLVAADSASRLGLGEEDLARAADMRSRSIAFMQRFAHEGYGEGAVAYGFWPRARSVDTPARRLLASAVRGDLRGPALHGTLAPRNVPAYPVAFRIWPDADDTALVHLSLRAEDPRRAPRLGALLRPYRAPSGAFYTWLPPPGSHPIENDVDAGVNANILLALAREGTLDSPGVAAAIRFCLASEGTSAYYPPGLTIAWLIARACDLGPVPALAPAVARWADRVEGGEFARNDPLQAALAALVLLHAHRPGPALDGALATVKGAQRRDGGWPAGAMWRATSMTGHRFEWASRAFTTALALEALARAAEARAP